MSDPFQSVTPDIGEETAAYTTPTDDERRKWWEIHKYEITEIAALTSIIAFGISILGHARRIIK